MSTTQPFRSLLQSERRNILPFVFAPVLIISLLVLIFHGGFRNIPLAVVNSDPGMELPGMGRMDIPAKVLSALNPGTVQVILTNETGAFDLARTHSVAGVLAFPATFTRDMVARMEDPSAPLTARISLKLNRVDFLTAMVLQQQILGSFMEMAKANGGSPLPLEMDVPMAGDGMTAADYLIPGLLALLAFIAVGFFSVSLASRNLRAYGATVPLVSLGASLLQFALVAAVLIPSFGMRVTGHWGMALVLYLLLVLVAVALGMVIGGWPRQTSAANPAMALFILPVFFSGSLLPRTLLPFWLKWLSFLMPPYWVASPARELMYGGGTADTFVLPVVLLIAVCYFCFRRAHVMVNGGTEQSTSPRTTEK